MKTHEIFCDVPDFQSLRDGTRRFLIQDEVNDFQPGDRLIVNEKSGYSSEYTGRNSTFVIRFILSNEKGLEKGYVALSLDEVINNYFSSGQLQSLLYDAFFAGARYAWSKDSNVDEMKVEFENWKETYFLIKNNHY